MTALAVLLIFGALLAGWLTRKDRLPIDKERRP